MVLSPGASEISNHDDGDQDSDDWNTDPDPQSDRWAIGDVPCPDVKDQPDEAENPGARYPPKCFKHVLLL